MKEKILFGIIALSTLCFSCKKNIPTPDIPTIAWGSIEGLKVNDSTLPRQGMNLDIRTSKSDECNPKMYSIIVLHDSKALSETIIFKWIPKEKIGTLPVSNQSSTNRFCDTVVTTNFSLIRGGDVLFGLYEPTRSISNFIKIDSYDKNTREITGSFDVTYLAWGTSDESRKLYPDTVRFKAAKFRVKVE